ncbi:FAD-dependent oxidoreductase [Taurinivorans muris]|uniref:FAD-dependent oxidoreductase n=1 Tax=Taurinivorans muris TaxID=2787751 RepID=A0ABY5XYM9_9BACT|nr:FAD-dependent oxidoreductase [Desulfovibrionaceae bacterium LT0009]
MLTFDAVVIGSGPAGLNASLYLVRAGLRTALIEKNSSGGQVLSTSEIENYLGFPKGVKGWELADLFTAHVNEYDVEHIRGEVLKIETIEENGAMHVLHMQNGDQVKTRAVIIATGASSRPLGVPEEETYKGKGVSYCALCDGNFYRGLDVAIVGGGNSALEEALYLSRIVNKIYIIHRREGFRGAQIYLDKIRAVPEKIELVTSCVVDSLAGEPTLKKVIVRHVETNEKRELPVEGIFVYIGHVSNARFVPENLERNEQGFILTDQEMQTNIPGIFAAGDTRAKLCSQVCTAVGDGATAANSAIRYLEQLNA